MSSPYPDNVVALAPDASNLKSIQFGEAGLFFHVILLKDSLWVWIGSAADQSLGNVSVALKDTAARVMGNNDVGARIASHLVKRFKQVAYVSYQGGQDDDAAALAESVLMKKLRDLL